MNFSDFGNKLCGESGILQLMDDLGKPLPKGVKPYRLGGGNPAQIPEIQAMYRQQMEKIMSSGDEFENLIGYYDSPQGRMSFIETVAGYLSKTYGSDLKMLLSAMAVKVPVSIFLIFFPALLQKTEKN